MPPVAGSRSPHSLGSPWPMRMGALLLREATDIDVEVLQSFRNDPDVNRFMVGTTSIRTTCVVSG